MSGSLLAALSPWLAFAIALRSGGVSLGWAGLTGLVAAAAVALLSWWHSTVRPFEIVTIGVFACLALTGLSVPGAWLGHFDHHGRPFSALCLAVVAFGSLTRRPFTEQYTSDLVPTRRLDTAAFAAANRRQTVAWGVTALLVAGSFLTATQFSGRVAATVFNWFVPLGAVWACVRHSSSRWYDEFGDQRLDSERVVTGLAPSPGRGPHAARTRPGSPPLRILGGRRR